jgi:tetrahydromethanopterin S-methyltransferase subunit G
LLKPIFLSGLLLVGFAFQALSQTAADTVKSKVDGVIAKAYQSASARFPCHLGTGKAKMLKWQGIEKCLNDANDRVDWTDVSQQIQKVGRDYGIRGGEMSGLIESSLLSHALPYDKVFIVKQDNALLPLSSSLLKFLPDNSLLGLPVTDSAGKEVGTFSGAYSFEKVGDVSGSLNRHRLFQYTDSKGQIKGSPEKLLLDSFAVPWKQAQSQAGFSLPPDKIVVR